jgi:hypothetical protein
VRVGDAVELGNVPSGPELPTCLVALPPGFTGGGDGGSGGCSLSDLSDPWCGVPPLGGCDFVTNPDCQGVGFPPVEGGWPVWGGYGGGTRGGTAPTSRGGSGISAGNTPPWQEPGSNPPWMSGIPGFSIPCDFGVCSPIGDGFVPAMAPAVPCLANPICATGLVLLTAAAIVYYEYQIHHQTQSQTKPGPEIDEACELFASEFKGSHTQCHYQCSQLGELCSNTSGSCPQFAMSRTLGPCN